MPAISRLWVSSRSRVSQQGHNAAHRAVDRAVADEAWEKVSKGIPHVTADNREDIRKALTDDWRRYP